MRQSGIDAARKIAVVHSPVNVRRLTPGLAVFAGMGYDFWIIDLYRKPELILDNLRQWQPAAIVTEWHEGLTEQLLQLGCPVIVSPTDDVGPNVYAVDVDDIAIGKIAAVHLMSRGYQKFAFVGKRGAHYAQQRLEGFQSVVGEVPVYWEEFRDWRQYDEYWREPDEDMVEWLLKWNDGRGVFTAHDPTGRHVLEAAAQAGIEVPFAMGVISANDDETVCEMARPGLSSIRLPWKRLAAEIVRVIESILDGNPPDSPVLIPPLEVVTRGSSSYEALGDGVVRKAMRDLVEHVPSIQSVEQWAARAGVSRRVLERRMHAALGRSPHSMILHERVERAKKLLTASDLPIAQIAEKCGYQSNERLSVNFRTVTGMAPMEYRRISREKISSP